MSARTKRRENRGIREEGRGGGKEEREEEGGRRRGESHTSLSCFAWLQWSN